MKSFIRGGQVSIHFIRMLKQVCKVLIKWGLLIAIIITSFIVYQKTSFLNWYVALKYTQASIIYSVGKDPTSALSVKSEEGMYYKTTVEEILSNELVFEHVVIIMDATYDAGIIVAYILGGVFLLVGLIFFLGGRYLAKEKLVRGGQVVNSQLLKKHILTENKKTAHKHPYFITGVPYPSYSESLHTLITGSTGVGKTQVINDLIEQIKQRGDRAIIYDKMGSFTESFYDAKKDILLNPLDERSPVWSIFKEARSPQDFKTIAAAMIPLERGSMDPFWSKAARTIFSNVCGVLWEKGGADNKVLLNALFRKNLEEVAELVEGTPAQTIIDPRSPKTALSVMSMISAYLDSMQYLKNEGEPFSIRNWVESEDENGMLFITSRGDQHETLMPLISAWIEIAVNSLLSLERNRERKIWIILDELPSLHYIPSLHSGLAESRQFGGAFVLSLQLMAQLRDIYGKDKAEATSGLCRTRVVFGSPDEDTAKWCSENLGRTEVNEFQEGVSYGAHEMRDGVSISTKKSLKPLVLPSEIMNLPNMEAYLKVAGDYPISRVKIDFVERKKISQKFVSSTTKNLIDKENLVKEKKAKVVDTLLEEL